MTVSNKKDKLRKLLERTPKAYNDFINGTLRDADEYNAYDKLIGFMEENPNATSSDVTYFLTVNILEIKPIK